jgi:hypothetical protein
LKQGEIHVPYVSSPFLDELLWVDTDRHSFGTLIWKKYRRPTSEKHYALFMSPFLTLQSIVRTYYTAKDEGKE